MSSHETKTKTKNELETDTYSDILEMLFRHQIRLKMYHFQTDLYGAHKGSDEYLVKFANNFDKLLEVLQGHEEKVNAIKSIHIDLQCDDDKTIILSLGRYIEALQTLINYKRVYNDAVDIIQGMIADAAQLKYLLTFK